MTFNRKKITPWCKDRGALIDAWVGGCHFGVPYKLFIKKLLFSPIPNIIENANRVKFLRNNIINVRESEHFIQFLIKGLDRPLFVPSSASSYYQTMDEIAAILDKRNDHYYFKNETEIASGDVVVDCGASEGLFSLVAALKSKIVYAIEPSPTYLKCLNRTFKNVDNVRIIPIALSSHTGDGYFSDFGTGSKLSYEQSNIRVRLDTIDNIFYHNGIKITYLKADLEGWEIDMLQGAIQTIRTSRPRMAITTYHIPSHAKDIANMILDIDPNYSIKMNGIRNRRLDGTIERCIWPIMIHAVPI